MALVILSRAAVLHIVYCFNERALGTVPGVAIGVPAMRLLFVRAALDDADPQMFELNGEQLRTLDTLLTDADPRAGKLPDGKPVLELVETIWRAMTGETGDSDGGDENHDHDAHESADHAALRGPGDGA